ncbi:MAG: hypothetical protein GQ572_10030 [Gammaproteobacteria bacterium]|jgi:hypothetical protein|nr:hypothetical protein [Gammaproteobacteria bacterium]
MSEIIKLEENIINKKDREQLESFGGHTIAHGRATRWHWHKADNGDVVFELFRGGADEVLAVCINRDRKLDAFYAHDAMGNMVSSGKLEHVMAELEQYFVQLHGD